jgi:hypothetical protein
MIFDNKVKLTAIDIKRDRQGVVRGESLGPFVVGFDAILQHGDGWVVLEGESGRTLVEEDAESISALIRRKLEEHEAYLAHHRRVGDTGMEEE